MRLSVIWSLKNSRTVWSLRQNRDGARIWHESEQETVIRSKRAVERSARAIERGQRAMQELKKLLRESYSGVFSRGR